MMSMGGYGVVQSSIAISSMERERAAIQSDLDGKKTIDERRRLGQFSTPYGLAREMVAQSLSFLPCDERISFLDPAFGTGAFYSALLDECGKERMESAMGIEIDPHYAVPAMKLWKDSGLEMAMSDFTDTDVVKKCNLLICNPPYVRHHLMSSDDKRRIKERTERLTGVSLSGLAGLYCLSCCNPFAS
jgi:type I restriction-modification system DNA methylase subunit